MYAKTRLGRFYYEEHGTSRNDDAIVLWPSLLCDGGMWDAQIEPLSKLGRVIVFDGPGHGKSDAPPEFTLWENADAVVDALDVLGVQRAIWCGLSWGGMIGMRLALAHPDRVKALALLDTNANAETRLNRLKYSFLVALAKPAGIPEPVFMRAVAPLYFAKKTLRERPEMADLMYKKVAGWPPHVVLRVAMTVAVERDDIAGKLAAIRAPSLVIHGQDDRAIPLERAQTITSRIPRAKLVTIPDAGHLSAQEQPARVNEALVPFVREHVS
jgi:3-oxoadipate enol-lactonase